MRRRNWLLVGAVVVAAVVSVAVLILRTWGPEGGEPTPDRAVAVYLAALSANDLDRLTAVADRGDNATADAKDHLHRFGSGRLAVTVTGIDGTESIHMKCATVTGRLDGRPFSGEVWLDQHEDRWYVRLDSSLRAA